MLKLVLHLRLSLSEELESKLVTLSLETSAGARQSSWLARLLTKPAIFTLIKLALYIPVGERKKNLSVCHPWKRYISCSIRMGWARELPLRTNGTVLSISYARRAMKHLAKWPNWYIYIMTNLEKSGQTGLSRFSHVFWLPLVQTLEHDERSAREAHRKYAFVGCHGSINRIGSLLF